MKRKIQALFGLACLASLGTAPAIASDYYDNGYLNLNSGIVFETTDQNGYPVIGTVSFSGGGVYRSTVRRADGTFEVTEFTDMQFLALELQANLSDPDMVYVDVDIYHKRRAGGDLGLGSDQRLFRALSLRVNSNQVIRAELRAIDEAAEWDILGSSVEDRALRIGGGTGVELFALRRADTEELDMAMTLVYGRISGVYAFSEGLKAEGSMEIFPLVVRNHSGSYGSGALAEAEARLELAIGKHRSIFLSDQLQLLAPLSGDGGPAQVYHTITGGLKLDW